MDKKGISTISPQGKINLRTMYEVIFFLETGMKIPGSVKRVPEKTKKNILKKYNLVYNKSLKQYIGNEDEIFNKLKEEFPDTIKKYNIHDWWKLMELCGK